MNRKVLLSSVMTLAWLVAGCGGKTPPASSPEAEPVAAAPASSSGSAQAAPSSSADVTRGVSALEAGDYNGARASFQAAIAKNPEQADAHYYLGVVMDKTGHKADAAKSYAEALSLAPNLHEAAENLTAIYIEQKKFDDAVKVAKASLAKNAKNPEMQLNLAVALAGKGDAKAATQAFDEAVRLAPNDARVFLVYGHQLALWKKKDKAVAKLKEAERVAGDDPAMLGSIGFELRTARAVPECIAAFDRAIEIKDNADFRTNRALCKLAAKDLPGATADLKAATSKEPAFAPAHYWLGTVLHRQGKFKEAAGEYDAYLKSAPKGPMAKAAAKKLALAKAKKKK